MYNNKQFRTDSNDNNLDESVFEHSQRIDEKHVQFSIEPSKEKDYDIYLMTGNNNGKGSEKK